MNDNSQSPTNTGAPSVSPPPAEERSALNRSTDKIVVGMFVVCGSVLGAFAGLMFSVGGGRVRGFGRVFPLDLGPALVVIALFTITSGLLSWRAARRALTKQFK